MQKKVISLMEDFCNTGDDIIFIKDYSGKYMYRRKCVGIICNNYLDVLVKLCAYLAIFGVEDFEEYLCGVKLDNMGLDYIIYFPKLKYI